MADKIKKLSDAIRLGATFHPQARFMFAARERDRTIIATCVLGAALEAVGLLDDQHEGAVTIHERFPDVPAEVVSGCIWLNDIKKYSREVIADWVTGKGY